MKVRDGRQVSVGRRGAESEILCVSLVWGEIECWLIDALSQVRTAHEQLNASGELVIAESATRELFSW